YTPVSGGFENRRDNTNPCPVSKTTEPKRAVVRSFRIKLFVAIMLVVSALTSLGIYLAHRNAEVDAETDLQHEFNAELASLHRLQELRNAAVAERCEVLASNPRIHAALEDNALDLLYPSAKEELRDLMMERAQENTASRAEPLH